MSLNPVIPRPEVWLVRHGESAANAGLPSPSHAEVVLTERGRQQAEQVAQRVNRRPDAIVCSPFVRARATAEPLLARWPGVPFEAWPIQEFSYLDAERCRDTTMEMRRPWAAAYWERADPAHVEGTGAESFAQFMQRLADFRARLVALGDAFVVAVGHGQFFRACLWGEARGYAATPEAMRDWRAAEIAQPMANADIWGWRPGVPARRGELDTERALTFLGGDEATWRELLRVFLEDAPGELADFRQALVPPGLTQSALRYLHRLVPTLAIIAAEPLHDEARDLHHALREDATQLIAQSPRARRLALRIEHLLDEARAQLAA